MTLQPTLREQKKTRTRETLAEAALSLFQRFGFDDTTVDQIAAAAGVSRRTFFRYFSTKEAAAFPKHGAQIDRFCEEIGLRRPGESALDVVRRACQHVAFDYFDDPDGARRQHEVVNGSPRLLSYERELDREWEAAMAQALAGPEGPGRTSRIMASMTIGALRAAIAEWFASETELDIYGLADEAFTLLSRGLGPLTEAR